MHWCVHWGQSHPLILKYPILLTLHKTTLEASPVIRRRPNSAVPVSKVALPLVDIAKFASGIIRFAEYMGDDSGLVRPLAISRKIAKKASILRFLVRRGLSPFYDILSDLSPHAAVTLERLNSRTMSDARPSSTPFSPSRTSRIRFPKTANAFQTTMQLA